MDYLKIMSGEELDDYANRVESEIQQIDMDIKELEDRKNHLLTHRSELCEIIDRIDGFVE